MLFRSDVILPEHLPPSVRKTGAEPALPLSFETPVQVTKTLEEQEYDAVAAALQQTKGNRTRAAELLGITRRGLIYKIKRLGLD